MVNAVKKKHITKTAANNKPLKNCGLSLRFSKETRLLELYMVRHRQG